MAYNYEYPYTDNGRYNNDWLLNRVKQLTEEWLSTKGEWNNTEAEWVELKNYVMSFFDKLDVQEEVNKKLDVMASNGTLTSIIQPFFSELSSDVHTLKEQKINRGEAASVSMGMLTQEVREAMTGGSVAVVGIDAVGTDNVQKGAITNEKITYNKNRYSNNLAKYLTFEDGKYYDRTGALKNDVSFKIGTLSSEHVRVGSVIYALYGGDTFNVSMITFLNNVGTVIGIYNSDSRGGYTHKADYSGCVAVVPENTASICITILSDEYAATTGASGLYVGYDGEITSEGSTIYPNTTFKNITGLDEDYLSGFLNKIKRSFVLPISKQYIYMRGLLWKFNDESGLFMDTSADTDACCSLPISLDNVKRIIIKAGVSAYSYFGYFADENGVPISQLRLTDISREQFPDGAKKYIFIDALDFPLDTYFVYDDGYEFARDIGGSGSTESNPYDGLRGVAFGTSLTYRSQTTGGYLQYLPNISGINFDNQGVGSSKIYGGASSSILNKLLTYEAYADKEVVLIEGLVNDWYNESPLGEYTDTTTDTVCGCLYQAINHVLTENPNANLFIVFDHYGKGGSSASCASTEVRGGFTQYQYYEECAKVCELLSVPVIKQYATSGISQYTPNYLIDDIHCNAAGALRSANSIWDVMKRHTPKASN